MPEEIHFIEQKRRTSAYLDDKFNININSLPGSELYLDNLAKSIISFKIWQKHLRDIIPSEPMNYLNEIISNHNQMLIMGIIGFKVPTYIMVRRSLENLLGFLYYKDHPIELIKKESGIGSKKTSITTDELKRYIQEFPFDSYYEDYDSNIMHQLLKSLIESWQEQYRDLSNFVHSSNSKYMELGAFLDDINADETSLNLLCDSIEKFRTISNVLLMIFFFNIYTSLERVEKAIITSAISEGYGYKQKIQDMFGGM